MMLPKTRRRIAALEADNATLRSELWATRDQLRHAGIDIDQREHTIRQARATAVRSRSTYQTLTMPYQHLSSVIAVLDGKDPLG